MGYGLRSATWQEGNAIRHSERFQVFREVYGVRKFPLALWADTFAVMRSVQVSKQIVATEMEGGGLDLPTKEKHNFHTFPID